MSTKNPKKSSPGPDPDRLKIDKNDWEDAVGDALEKERPKDGWPKPDKGKEKDQQDD